MAADPWSETGKMTSPRSGERAESIEMVRVWCGYSMEQREPIYLQSKHGRGKADGAGVNSADEVGKDSCEVL